MPDRGGPSSQCMDAATQALLQAGLDGILNGILRPLMVLAPDGRTLGLSPAARKLFGFRDGEEVGSYLTENPWFQEAPDRLAAVRDAFQRAVSGQQSFCMLPAPTLDQAGYRARMVLTPVRDSQGRVSAVFVERDPAEMAPVGAPPSLPDSGLRFALEDCRVIPAVWEVETGALTLHHWVYEIFRIQEHPQPRNFEDCFQWIHPEDQAAVRAELDRALAGRTELRAEFRVLKPGGEEAWWTVSGVVQRRNDGRPLRVAGIAMEITARKRAEQTLRENEERFRAIFEHSAAGIAIGGIDGRFEHVNSAFCQMLGYSAEELQQLRGPDISHPETRHLAEDYLRAAAAGDVAPLQAERRLVRKDGSVIWARISAGPIRLDGKLSGLLLVAQDITVQKQAAEAVRESESRFREMADSSPACLWMTDAAGRTEFVNKALVQFLGSEISSSPEVLQYVHPEDRERVRSAFERGADQRAPFACEYRVRRADGIYRWVLDHGTPRFSADGTFLGYAGSALDITDRLDAEQALRQELQRRAEMEEELQALSQRLIDAQEQIRQEIARELHDDLGQRIAALGYGLFNLKRKLGDLHPEAQEALRRLEENIARLGADIRRLSHRLHPAALEHAGLKAALKALAAEFTASGLKVTARLHHPEEGLCPEVQVTLFRVAQEALQNVARHSGVHEAELELLEENGCTRLRITDHGAGFDPSAQRGHGLGLISMRERARLLAGTFVVDSAPGRGTRITLEIPSTPT